MLEATAAIGDVGVGSGQDLGVRPAQPAADATLLEGQFGLSQLVTGGLMALTGVGERGFGGGQGGFAVAVTVDLVAAQVEVHFPVGAGGRVETARRASVNWA